MDSSQDLFAFFDDADLATMMASSDQEAKQLLEAVLGVEAIAKAMNNRDKTRRELGGPIGLAQPNVIDPDLPEIVLLHGITDSHLANTAGRRNRIWLDYLELLKGRFTRYLTLQPDGVSDQHGVTLETDGSISKKYQNALDAWNENGFATHVFCYDWRKSVNHAADDLDLFLRQLPSVVAGRKVVLVCHSMGGLVASAFAARHDHWESFIEHAVLVGSPLGGAYSAAIAIMGKSPSFKKMGLLSLTESLEDFQRMAASFPGLLDLLPNPEIFPEAADLYSPLGWPGKVKPAQQWLTNSLDLKSVVWNSPLFSKSTHLISQDFATVSEMPWNVQHDDRESDVVSPFGDGAVLNQSSLVPGLTAYKIPGAHAMLVVEPKVIDAVMQIAKGESVELDELSINDYQDSPRSTENGPMGLAAAALPSGSDDSAPSNTELFDKMAQELLEKSDASRGALLGLSANTGAFSFDRSELKEVESFSWQNSLSLAIASEVAYKGGAELLRIARADWGFAGVMPIQAGNHQGFVAWDDEVVLLSFRGTEKNVQDWLGNFNVFGSKWGDLGEIHSGFLGGFNGLKPEIDSIFSTINAASKKVWITGHSLGGALAVLAGAAYQADLTISGVYTYGQPKVGGQQLTDFYHQKFSERYVRFVNNEDAVPMVPPGYQHGGRLIWFDENGDYDKPGTLAEGPMGLAMPNSADGNSGPKELTAAEFKRMQHELTGTVTSRDPDEPVGLAFPSLGIRDRLREMIGISFSDHSIRDAYIPIIKRHLEEQNG